jgi:hypothetical protein
MVEFSLTKDLIDNVPPYAILSHTWGDDDEEATFQDLAQDVGKNKAGYRKILFCEEQATRDGLQYVWVDTCCIDKSNSTELAEAINSMFRWYREAAKCYVYLSDVSTRSLMKMFNSPGSRGNPAFHLTEIPTLQVVESSLPRLKKSYFVGGRTTKVAITGLGGIGKTQLVLELVYRIRDRYKNCLVIWIPATNMESLHQAYQDVARQLKIPGSDEDKADAKKLVQAYLSKESVGRWLLVFDNADDVNMWINLSGTGPGSGRLIDYLPRSEQGCIVFTTRDRKTAVKLAHQNVVEVPEMDEDVAIQLLQKCLVNPDLVNNRPDTTALLKELTCLPLAIVQAAAYINENGIAFVDYLSLLADQEEAVIDLLSEEFEDDGRYDNVKNPWLRRGSSRLNRFGIAILSQQTTCRLWPV